MSPTHKKARRWHMTTNETPALSPGASVRGGQSSRMPAAVITFFLIVIVLMVIALLNAPTMGGPKVMSSVNTYLQEVRRTALPFLGVVAIVAILIGLVAARIVFREWSNPKRRLNLIMGYLFL